MTAAKLPDHPDIKEIHKILNKVSEKAIGVSNPESDTIRNLTTEQYLQNLEAVENIVDELQKRFNLKIKGWDRNILVEMAWLHTDRRNGFTAATIKLLLERLEQKKIMVKGKMIGYHNLRKKIKWMYKKGIIVRLSDKDGHRDQYVLANMQDLYGERNDKKIKKYRGRSASNTLYIAYDDVKIEENLYQIIEERNKNNNNLGNNQYLEPEFHHIQLNTQLNSPQEYYEKLKTNENWTLVSKNNQGLKYEGRMSRTRTFTIMAYPCGSVTIMVKCTKDPFRWYPRDDWIVLYDICNSIQQLLREHLELGFSDPLIHTTYLDWLVTQLHLGYDLQVPNNEVKRKSTYKLDISKFDIPVRVRNLDGVSCQVYSKRTPHKGAVIRFEEHIDFSSNIDKHRSKKSHPAPSLRSLKSKIKPKSIESILDIVYPK